MVWYGMETESHKFLNYCCWEGNQANFSGAYKNDAVKQIQLILCCL